MTAYAIRAGALLIGYALAALLVLGAVLGACELAGNLSRDADASAPLPTCPEDAALVGTGSYQDGRWSAYECGPAVDDYAPPGADPSHAAPIPSAWPVTLPDEIAGQDLEDLCAELEAPGEVPECADLGY